MQKSVVLQRGMANTDACVQATYVCGRFPCQQDGPYCLGDDGKGRGLQSSGRNGIAVSRSEVAESVGRTKGWYGATVDETGSENQFCTRCIKHAHLIWI